MATDVSFINEKILPVEKKTMLPQNQLGMFGLCYHKFRFGDDEEVFLLKRNSIIFELVLIIGDEQNSKKEKKDLL